MTLGMPLSDRAFRAFAREEPHIVVELLELVAPGVVPRARRVSPRRVDDPHLDPPRAMDADWVARVGKTDVVHVECQGYRDETFLERLFRYHLSLVLRYPKRRIRTIALWVIRPPPEQRLHELSSQGVDVEVTSVVLPEVSAELLLRSPRTSCFAPGAHPGSMTAAELCDATVRALHANRATERQWLLAAMLAATRGTYRAMVIAMQRAGVEPVIIEDLVRFGVDQGIEQGRAEGRAEALLGVLRARGLTPTEAQRDQILACTDIAVLDAWIGRAAVASSVDDVLG